MDPLICKDCGGELRRSKRSALERLRYSEAYRCKDCGSRSRVSIRFRIRDFRYTKCPKCQCHDLTILKKVDKIDTMRKSTFSLLNRFLGGNLYHCWFCRLQFYDLRPRKYVAKPASMRIEAGKNAKQASRVSEMPGSF